MKIDIRTLVAAPAFWVVILIGLVAQVVPYILTLGAPAADGNTVAGFPFTFYSFGGLCGFPGGKAGQCPSSFVPLYVFFDAALVIGLALFVSARRQKPTEL